MLGSQYWDKLKTKVKSRTNCQVKICLNWNQIMSSKYLKSLTESQALSLRLGQWNRLDCCWSYLLIAINISKLNAKIYELTKYTGCHKKWGNVFWAHFEGVTSSNQLAWQLYWQNQKLSYLPLFDFLPPQNEPRNYLLIFQTPYIFW